MLNNKKRIIYLILTILMMIVIFSFSSQSSNNSNHLSYSISNFIFEKIAPQEAMKYKDNEELFPTSNETFRIINFVIRKSAHVFQYMMLGIFMFLFVKTYNVSIKQVVLITISTCFLYACLDEFNQYLGGTRTGTFVDSLIDTSGCMIGCGLNYVYIVIAKRKKF